MEKSNLYRCSLKKVNWDIAVNLYSLGFNILLSKYDSTSYMLDSELFEQDKYDQQHCEIVNIHTVNLCLIDHWVHFNKIHDCGENVYMYVDRAELTDYRVSYGEYPVFTIYEHGTYKKVMVTEVCIAEVKEQASESTQDSVQASESTQDSVQASESTQDSVQASESTYNNLEIIKYMLGDIINKSDYFNSENTYEIKEKIMCLMGDIENYQAEIK